METGEISPSNRHLHSMNSGGDFFAGSRVCSLCVSMGSAAEMNNAQTNSGLQYIQDSLASTVSQPNSECLSELKPLGHPKKRIPSGLLPKLPIQFHARISPFGVGCRRGGEKWRGEDGERGAVLISSGLEKVRRLCQKSTNSVARRRGWCASEARRCCGWPLAWAQDRQSNAV